MIRRVVRALARPFLPRGYVGDSMLADLEREYARPGGSTRGDLWYAGEVLSMAAHQVWAWLTRPFRRRHPSERRGDLVDKVGRDIHFALRRLGRRPAFTLVAGITIALGIGANVAIFSVVKTVLLEPLPYDASEELVAVWEWNVPRDRRDNVANPGNVRAWRERSETLAQVEAVVLSQAVTLTDVGDPEEIALRMVTPGFFDMLGLEAALGRTPVAGDGSEVVDIVLSYGYWQRRFGGDREVLGRTARVNGEAGVIVGVMPPVYMVFGEEADAWVSWPLQGDQTNTGRFLYTVARLAPGATVEQAREEMLAMGAALEEEFPDMNSGWTVNVVPLREQVIGDADAALWILFGAVGLLLLIACVNVANLFLASATERQREMAVRTSLGATGGTLAGQLLVEGMLVAFLGAAGGVWLAHVGTGFLATSVPDAFALPRVDGVGVDGGVLLFAMGISVLTGLLFGVAPAAQAGRVAPATTLNAEGRGPSRQSGRLRNALVVTEVALSVMLLVGAGLLARSFVSLTSVDAGIDPANVLSARVNLSGEAYRGREPDVRFFTEYHQRLAALPGVEAAGGITFLPMGGLGAGTSFYVLDRPIPPRADWPVADIRNVVGDYFEAMGMRLVRGRFFDARDREDAPQVAVINRFLAEKHWPGQDAIGKRIKVNWGENDVVEVVGVVEDVRLAGLDADPREAIYMPYRQKPYFDQVNMVLRSTLPPASLGRSMQRELHAMDPGLALSEPRLMDDIVHDSIARPRLTTTLMLVFAALAALLAAVGLYGVLAYTVAQRTRELGVRIAIGARPGQVVRLVVRQGLTMAGAGLVLGLLAAAAGGRLLESVLFGVQPLDLVSMAAAASLLLAVALAATGLPAWRASRVAPVEELRAE